MNQAEELFAKLQSLQNAKEFLEYCKQVLGAVERIHVDFKEKHDSRIPKLEDDDKRNLAKAVSGFANSGGGVLIWGMEDKTLKSKPITNIQQFMQNLLQLAPQVTDPIAGKLDGHWIVSNSESGEGFGILFIPESILPPHRVVLNFGEIRNHYYVRSGNSFIEASHTMLEDMFGRRPKPELALITRTVPRGSRSGKSGTIYQFAVILGISNKGRGIAKSPFFAIRVNEPYKLSFYGLDGKSSFGLPHITSRSNNQEGKYGGTQTYVIHSGIVHEVTAIDVEIDLSRAKEMPDLVLEYQIAAEGIQLIQDRIIMKISTILSQFGHQIT